MKVTGRIEETRIEVKRARESGGIVGLVPTMGALHEAHLSLVRRVVEDGCFTVVSIYVNPSQFGPAEDFDKYPRSLEKDLALCEKEGVGLVFTPSNDVMYAGEHRTWVNVEELTAGLCGALRPGHFRGVATIVTKLFSVVLPDAAYFGRKDFQQLKVIERMTADLNLPVKIVGCPTLRDDDGIAMSSRNAYLSEQERERAKVIPRTWSRLSSRWQAGERSARGLMAGLREELERSVDTVEYFGLYHPETLRELPDEGFPDVRPVAALAVRVGKTRLIDNFQPGVDLIKISS